MRGRRAGDHNETCRVRIDRELTLQGDIRIVKEVEEMLGEAVDPADIGPQEDRMEEELGVDSPEELAVSENGDNMSVGQSSAAERMVCEITADPYKAKRLANWELSVSKQWSGKQWCDGVMQMESELGNNDVHSHVSEVYSPPRVTGLAAGMGLIPGMALDLSVVDPDDGKPWDFNDSQKRAKVLKRVFTERSLLLIGSPMCSSFSSLQNLNWGRMDPEEVERVKSYGKKHLEFACKLYALQDEMNLYFLHEHPSSATSWQQPCVTKLLARDKVQRVVSDMCVFGMQQEVDGVNMLVKKPTAFMTNAPELARRLTQRCSGGHRHITLIGGRAKRAEIYPDQLCREILLGLVDKMRVDGRLLGNGCLGSVVKCDESTQEYQTEMSRYWDNVPGKELDPVNVTRARQEEMEEFGKHNV